MRVCIRVFVSHPHTAQQTCISISCAGVSSSVHMVMDGVCGTCQPPHHVKALVYRKGARGVGGAV